MFVLCFFEFIRAAGLWKGVSDAGRRGDERGSQRWGTGGCDDSAGGPVAALGNRRLRLLLGADSRMTGQWWAIGGVFGYIAPPPVLPPTDKLPVGCMQRFHGYTTHRSENSAQNERNAAEIH